MPNKIRIRDAAQCQEDVWLKGDVPDEVVKVLAQQIIAHKAIGATDIRGEDFSEMFSVAVNGNHHNSPIGLLDVTKGEIGWSCKTVRGQEDVFAQEQVRLITGRNSIAYSAGIKGDPTRDSPAAQSAGEAVLGIYRERLKVARKSHNDLRLIVLLRNAENSRFVLFESELENFAPSGYIWRVNSNGNLEGYEKSRNKGEEHRFTWQPNGAQFTVFHRVPPSAKHCFEVDSKPPIKTEDILRLVGFKPEDIRHFPNTFGVNPSSLSLPQEEGVPLDAANAPIMERRTSPCKAAPRLTCEQRHPGIPRTNNASGQCRECKRINAANWKSQQAAMQAPSQGVI